MSAGTLPLIFLVAGLLIVLVLLMVYYGAKDDNHELRQWAIRNGRNIPDDVTGWSALWWERERYNRGK
jgi:hypothetical protein